MESKKDIGAFFKSNLDKAKRSPSDSLWDKIDASLDKNEKQRKRPFLLIIPAILVLVILGILIFQKSDIPSSSNTHDHSSEEINSDLKENNSIERSIIKNSSEVKIDPSAPFGNREEIEIKIFDDNKVSTTNGKTQHASVAESTDNSNNSEESKDISDQHSIIYSQEAVSRKSENSPVPSSGTVVGKLDGNESFEKGTPEKSDIKKDFNTSTLKENSSSISKNDSDKNDSDKRDSKAFVTIETPQAITEKDSVVQDSTALATLEKSNKTPKKQSDKNGTKIQKKKLSKWSITAIGGPVYFNISENTSPIDRRFDGIETTGKIDFAYGLGAGFNVSENLSISYAAIRTKFTYSLRDIPAATSQDLSRILASSGLDRNDDVTLEGLTMFTGNDETTTLRQSIEYVELPLQITYSLGESRLGVQVFGGFSTYIFTNDIIFIENSNDQKFTLGTANNLLNLNFSLNAGFGAYYKLSDKFKLEINPTFKYHIKLLDSPNRNTSGISIGLYTGIKYNLNQ